jgi:predicted metal-binding membrane protein
MSDVHPQISPLAKSGPFLGWTAFYLIVALAWIGLIALDGNTVPGDFWTRCLVAPGALGFAHLVAMWALMSLGMMLPTALPALQRLSVLVQNRADGLAAHRFLSFVAGYAAIWLGFSLAAATLQMWLSNLGWLGPDGRIRDGFVAAALLAFAGLYQFSKLKHACLTRCRHPMTFFMANWRDGRRGAFWMGLKHGSDCLGCCWALMLLAFVGGTMSLAWMGLAMVLMMLEKLAGPGRYVTLPLGLLLVSAAGFMLGNALLAA